MIRRPPRSTLFPTRRSSDLDGVRAEALGDILGDRRLGLRGAGGAGWAGSAVAWSAASTPQAQARSEEHTSELQSQFHLVCRLLLEKKKKTRTTARRSIRNQS